MSEAVKPKEKQKWAIEKPKLDSARKLRGDYFIDSADEEFKDIMTNARRKLEFPMPAAIPCKTRREEHKKPAASRKIVRQNTPALLKPANLRETVRKKLFIKVIKIILQEEELIH